MILIEAIVDSFCGEVDSVTMFEPAIPMEQAYKVARDMNLRNPYFQKATLVNKIEWTLCGEIDARLEFRVPISVEMAKRVCEGTFPGTPQYYFGDRLVA
jgi:hypothetical protein